MEWSAFKRVFGPITIHERLDWIAAEIVSTLSGQKMDTTLLRWDQPSLFPEKAEEANAMNLETLLKGSMDRRRLSGDDI